MFKAENADHFGEAGKAKAGLVAECIYLSIYQPRDHELPPSPASIRLIVAGFLRRITAVFSAFDAEQAFMKSKPDADAYVQMP